MVADRADPHSVTPAMAERGFALLVTLWALVMVSTLMLHLAYQSRVESNLARWSMNQSLLGWATRGAAHLAAARVAAHAGDEYNIPTAEWWTGKAYQALKLGAATVFFRRPPFSGKPTYGLDDEESRLNVNAATPEQLMSLHGISSVMAEAIVRYREKLREKQNAAKQDANLKITFFAEKRESPNRDLIDGPIRSLNELMAVKGVTEDLLYRAKEERRPLADLLTTLSSGKVNVNSASEAVLLAAGLNEGQVNAVVAARNKKPISSIDELKLTIGNTKMPELWSRVEKMVAVRSSTFRVVVEARLPFPHTFYGLNATLHVTSGKWRFLRWREVGHETLSGI